VQVSLYHHQLTQQFVDHVCQVRPHEQFASAEHAFNMGRSRRWAENLKEYMQDFKMLGFAWLRPTILSRFTDARRWCLIFHMLR